MTLEEPPESLSSNGECVTGTVKAPTVYSPTIRVVRRRILFVLVWVELRPAALKETPHGVSGHSHLWCVLVEELAVVEDKLSVRRELLTAAVPETKTQNGKVTKKGLIISKGALTDEIKAM